MIYKYKQPCKSPILRYTGIIISKTNNKNMETIRLVINNPSPKLLQLMEKMKAHKDEKMKMLSKKSAIYFPKK